MTPYKDTILIVDNSPINTRLFLHFLANKVGFRVLVAHNGQSALQIASATVLDLILLDAMMPDMDGFQLCEQLKSEERTRDIPIIFMTALDKTEDKIKGFRLGAADYITKPIQPEELLARVTTHLTIRNQQKQALFKKNQQLQQEIAVRKQTENALREREQTLSGILNAATETIVLLETDGTCITINPTGAARFGKTVAEIEGQCVYDLMQPKVAKKRKALIEQVARTGEPILLEDERADIWFESLINPVFNQDDTVERIAIFARDITKRKTAENLLKIQRDIDIALNSSHHLIGVLNCILETALKMNEIDYGDSYIFDASLQDLKLVAHKDGSPNYKTPISKTQADSLDSWIVVGGKFTYIHPNQLPIKAAEIWQSKGLRTVVCLPIQHNGQMISVINLASHTHEKFSILTRHTIEFIAAQVSEVIIRLEMDAALKLSEKRYRAIVENQTELVCRFLPDTTLTFVNDAYCHYFDIPVEDLLGKQFLSLLPEKDRQLIHSHLQILFNNPKIDQQSHEHQVFDANGKIVWQRWTNLALRDKNDVIIEFQSVGIDITERKQAEEALQASKDFINKINQVMPNIVFIFDVIEKKVLYVNEQIETYLGYSPPVIKEMGSRVITELTHPEDLNLVIENQQKLAKALDGEVIEAEYRLKHAQGNWCWFLRKAVVFERNAAGQAKQFLAVSQDITERKQAEEALRKSEERFELAMRGATDGLWDINYETEQAYYSPRFKQMLGFDEPESLTPDEVILMLHPDDVDEVLSVSKAYIDQKISHFKHTFRIRHKQGHYIWVLSRAIAVWNKQGQPLRMVGTNMDLTLQKQIEDELRQQQEFLRLVIDSVPQFIFWKDRKSRYLGCNQNFAKIANVDTPEQIIGKTDFDLPLTAEQMAFYRTVDRRVMESNTPEYHIIETVQLADGQQRWLDTNKIPLHNAVGEVMGILGSFEDITERKQAEEQLQKALQAAEVANHAKSAFLANMSHELRTPLNAVLGYTQIFLTDKTLDKQLQEGIEIIHRNSEYLLALINDILDISKVEAGQLEFSPKDIDFSKFLSGITELFQMRTQQKNIVFDYKALSALPPIIHADEKRLRQILLNLLSNAMKFTEKGSVSLKVKSEPANLKSEGRTKKNTLSTHHSYVTLHFQIEDTGVGMTSNELDKIFLPFQQAGESDYKSMGTGLGLSITQKLVETMEGSIQVDSELGKGSIFRVKLDLPAVFDSKLSDASADNRQLTLPETQETLPDNLIAMKGPNPKQAATLYEFTMRGDVDNIIEYIKQLEQTDEQLGQFVQQIYTLADQLAIKKIRQIIKQYLSSE
jgi:PAS domain S-box-containing protein